jgi:hypothetical protein
MRSNINDAKHMMIAYADRIYNQLVLLMSLNNENGSKGVKTIWEQESSSVSKTGANCTQANPHIYLNDNQRMP